MNQYNNPVKQIQRIKHRQRQITQKLKTEKDEKNIIKLLRETHNLTIRRLGLEGRTEGICR